MSDCLIIGAGLMGMLSALELHNAGLRVTLLERGQPAREASWAGGGILSPLYPWMYADAVNDLASWSQRVYPDYCSDWLERSGVDPQWTQCGLLIADPSEPDRLAAWQQRYTVSAARVDAIRLHDIEPRLAIQPAEALWLPEVAQVRSPRLVKSLRRVLELAGVEFRTGCPVTGWSIDGQRVAAVCTPQGELSAASFIVASGAWSGDLLAPTGLALQVGPVRGQMLLFKGPPGLVKTMTLYQQRYVIPRRDGRVLVGSTLEYVGYDKQTTPEARAELLRAACELIPELEHQPVEHHWAGLRPGSPQGIPVIGPHPGLDNLFINAGQFRNGVVLAPASARLLADHVLGRQPVFRAADYLPAKLAKTG